MKVRSNTIALTYILLLSLAAICIWLFELLKIVGWEGLRWVGHQLYSPYICTLIATISFLVPFFINNRIRIKKVIVSLLILYGINIFCFEINRQLCYALYCDACYWSVTQFNLILVVEFTVFVLLGFIHWYVSNKLLIKNRKINILYITILLLLSIPLSFFTININTGFGTEKGFIDMVKMGYPVFWTTLMLGISGMMITNQKTIKSS